MSLLKADTKSKIALLEAKPLALPGGKNYKPELDVIRFIAVFTVYLHHTVDSRALLSTHFDNALYHLWNSMGFGLISFFLLSGYLITTILLREKVNTGTVKVTAFLSRRMLRLWPLYFFALLVGCVYELKVHQFIGMRYAAFLLMMGNWYCFYYGNILAPIGPLWSISAQEQFYLFWPLAVKKASRTMMTAISLMLILLAVGTLFYLGEKHASKDPIWFNGFISYGVFGIGILIAIRMFNKKNALLMWQRVVLLLICPICWFAAEFYFHLRELENAQSGIGLVAGYALAVIGSLALLMGLMDIPRHYIPGWLAYLGRISYGMYIFHMPVFMFVKHRLVFPYLNSALPINRNLASLIAFPIVIVVAALSFKYFESWFLKLKPVRAL